MSLQLQQFHGFIHSWNYWIFFIDFTKFWHVFNEFQPHHPSCSDYSDLSGKVSTVVTVQPIVRRASLGPLRISPVTLPTSGGDVRVSRGGRIPLFAGYSFFTQWKGFVLARQERSGGLYPSGIFIARKMSTSSTPGPSVSFDGFQYGP